MVKLPPVSFPASGWPTVPLTVNFPPLLVAPPLSTVDQRRSYWPPLCACAPIVPRDIKSSVGRINLAFIKSSRFSNLVRLLENDKHLDDAPLAVQRLQRFSNNSADPCAPIGFHRVAGRR